VLFPTVEFSLFFLFALLVSWALAGDLRVHRRFLLLASWGFYAFWDARLLPLLVLLSLFGTALTRHVQQEEDPAKAKRWLLVGIVGSLATLAFFKYLGFLASVVLDAVGLLGLTFQPKLPEVALPVGISFFVFHVISMLVDGYRRKLTEQVGWEEGLLYVAFFPQLVAGPILRASEFLPQLRRGPMASEVETGTALRLIASGLVKKVLIAGTLSSCVVDSVFTMPEGNGGLRAWAAVYGYGAQIYADFSGYTDMAAGCALLLGYRFPPNFDAPYSSTSIGEFWRRWHISLSSWLRDYLYIPLGGNRGTARTTERNLLLTMVLGGLWHGASWNFLFWGLLHGLALAVERRFTASDAGIRLSRSRWYAPVMGVVTFHFVLLAWIPFRATSAADTWAILRSLFRGGSGEVAPAVWVALAAAYLPQWFGGLGAKLEEALDRLPTTVQGAVLGGVIFLVEALGPSGIAPFIYFQF
jgi:alginate O-acetyltransferase complex protein AlgI